MIPKIPIERAGVMLALVKEFQNLLAADLEIVAGNCQWRRYIAGENVIEYHDTTTNVFFILQGELRVTYYSSLGHEVILCDLSAGEMFGELTAIDGRVRSALVVAKTDAIIASMSGSQFLHLIQTHPKICISVLNRLTAQVRRLTDRVYDYSTLPVSARIHVELLRLAKTPSPPSNMGVISPAPTHADIANTLSTHREAVTRELNKLRRAGLIAKQGHELCILDMAELRRMVQKARNC
jgi:CRP-like cAMP-binding protein